MKQFIYMDTDIINSYIAQNDNGLRVNIKQEVTERKDCSKTQSETIGDTDLGFNIGVLKTNTKGTSEINSTMLTTSEAGKELIEKIAHDDVFNKFFNMVNENERIKRDDFTIGDYIKIKGEFSIYDLDYFSDIFVEKTIDVIIRSELIEKEKNGSMKPAEKKAYTFNAKKRYKESVLDMIDLCKRVLPSKKFILLKDTFILLDEKYLRENCSKIRLLYSSEITLIGKYTNDLFKKSYSYCNHLDDVFTSIDEIINVFLSSTLGLDKNVKVILPIALYFE